jgi:beta-1,4-N-acetylglucosaminyltransferase
MMGSFFDRAAKKMYSIIDAIFSREIKEKAKKICFAASSGGHFEQITMLKPLMEKYESCVVTEKTKYKTSVNGLKMYYMHQVNRKEVTFPFWMIVNAFKSIGIFMKEKPDVVITTGVLAMIPLCLLAKMFKKKLIYIESFAKVFSPTETGKLMYKYADQFYVQWESMLKFYPNAIYLGGIY